MNQTFDPVTGVPVVISGVDASWALGGTLNFLPTRQIENTTNLYQLLAGFRGSLGLSDWTAVPDTRPRTGARMTGVRSTEGRAWRDEAVAGLVGLNPSGRSDPQF